MFQKVKSGGQALVRMLVLKSMAKATYFRGLLSFIENFHMVFIS